jgi:hypothetical protein
VEFQKRRPLVENFAAAIRTRNFSIAKIFARLCAMPNDAMPNPKKKFHLAAPFANATQTRPTMVPCASLALCAPHHSNVPFKPVDAIAFVILSKQRHALPWRAQARTVG